MNNFTEILTYQAKKQPDSIAIISENEQITYKELDDLVWKCAAYLHQQGIKEGDVVIHMLENDLLIIISMFASARLGATLLPVPRTIPKKFLEETINELDASFIISDLENLLIKKLKYIDLKKEDFKNLKIDFSIYVINPKSPWQIIMSSGSTGKRKLIPIYNYKFNNRLELTKSWFPINKNDIVSSFTPLEYSSAKSILCETLKMCGTYVLLPKNKPSINLINKFNITILHSTVFHIEKILKNIDSDNKQFLTNLKMLLMGASKIDYNLRKRIKKNLTNNLYIRYGINEIGNVSITSLPQVFSNNENVGSVVHEVKLEIVDNNHNLKAVNEIGLIRIKSPAMAERYLNDQEATRKAFKDGWFYPGDMGKLTEDGQLIHLGRADDMMIMNGINIYPSQIENSMLENSKVEEAYAFPLKHEIAQDLPVCVVVLKKDSKASEKELMEYAYEHLGSYRPQLIIILDKSPRNEQGKVVRKDLIKIVQEKIKKEQTSMISSKVSRKYKQNTKKLQIVFSNPKIDIDILDKNMESFFDIDTQNETSYTLKPKNKDEKFVLDLAWRILLIRRELLQILRLPIFDIGEITSIDKKEDNYVVNILAPTILNISSNIYENIQKIATLLLGKVQFLNDKNKKIQLYKHILKELNTLKKQLHIPFTQKSTMPILEAANNKNIPFEHLGQGLYQIGWGKNSHIMSRSASWNDSNLGVQLSENKILTANRLRNCGFPAPNHGIANNFNQALNIAKQLGYPVVTKPIDLNRGEGVSVDITNEDLLKKGFELANKNNKQVIVERQVQGVCTRVFIANGKMYYAVNRLPKSVLGDGINSIEKLIISSNQKNEKLPPWKRTEYFPKDDEAIKSILDAGFSLGDIPKESEIIPLRRIESTQDGGYDEDVTKTIHPDNIDISIRAAKLFGLHIAGVDIISSDITKPWYETGAIINEVNYAPLYGGGEIAKATIPEFLDDFIPKNGRIDITVVVGDEQALKKAKQLQKKAMKSKKTLFLTTHNQTFDQNQKEIIMPLNSLFQRTKALLMNQDVEELIIVVQTDEWLQNGLPIDCIDNLIFVNENIDYTLKNTNLFDQLKFLLESIS